MKKFVIVSTLIFISVVSFGQSEKYVAAMKKNLSAIDTSFKNPADLLALANNFERIATAEKNQWLAYYYAAFCQVNYGFMQQDKDKVDAIADKLNHKEGYKQVKEEVAKIDAQSKCL